MVTNSTMNSRTRPRRRDDYRGHTPFRHTGRHRATGHGAAKPPVVIDFASWVLARSLGTISAENSVTLAIDGSRGAARTQTVSDIAPLGMAPWRDPPGPSFEAPPVVSDHQSPAIRQSLSDTQHVRRGDGAARSNVRGDGAIGTMAARLHRQISSWLGKRKVRELDVPPEHVEKLSARTSNILLAMAIDGLGK